MGPCRKKGDEVSARVRDRIGADGLRPVSREIAGIDGVEAICLDGDGTLWDYERSMRYALDRVLSELRNVRLDAASQLTVDLMVRVREEVAKSLRGASLEKIRLEAFREALKRVGAPEDPLGLWMNDLYRSYRSEGIVLFEDVLPVLRRLEGRYRVGLLSNGNTDPGCCGLADIMDFAVFAHQHGVEKPDPSIFRHAAKKAGCRTDLMVHVGDSIEDDVVGARNAGALPIWLNRAGTAPDPGVEIEVEIDSLWPLLEILL